MFALVIFVFVIGELLWVPTSQAVVASLAPEEERGSSMGAFGSTAAGGFAIGPFVGLQLRGTLRRRGDVGVLRRRLGARGAHGGRCRTGCAGALGDPGGCGFAATLS